MAEVLEISANHAGLLERGQRLPSLATLVDIAAALNVSLDVVFFGHPDGRLAIRNELADMVASIPEEVRPVVLEFLRAGVAALSKRGRAPR